MIYRDQYQFGYGILKMVGSKKEEFRPKINIPTQRKPLYFENTGSPSSSKFGHDFNKVVRKLKLEKNVFCKKWSPKLIFLNEFFF
jgi:hypothetical protein